MKKRSHKIFPVVLEGGLDKKYYGAKWQTQFVDPGRRRAEGIWRRTQSEETMKFSGWKSAQDARRRMIHFLDEYDLVENDGGTFDFVISNAYLWMSVTLPEQELVEYHQKVLEALDSARWLIEKDNKYRFHDLTLKVIHHDVHPEDTKVSRDLPSNYRTLEYVLMSDGMTIEERVIDSPWNILNSGVRKQGTRAQNPRIIEDVVELTKFLPVQIEIAGGASLELGIPPLNHLHTVYNVTRKEDKTFVFEEDSFLPDLIRDPSAFYRKAGEAYKTCILAEPNDFYLTLKQLYEKKIAVGDIITNNFDGLPSLIGIKERYIRRYDEMRHYPKIDFDTKARSLLVIGNHADRRQVQKQARERGMRVFYVDPEMYVDYFGNPVNYPLEHIKDEDYLFKMEAGQFAKILRDSMADLESSLNN